MALLDLVVDDKFQITDQEFLEKRGIILGITGSGKSNTVARIMEQLLRRGVPLTIVDPHGEYYSLKEKFEMLVVGRSDHAEIDVPLDKAETLAEQAVAQKVPIILDFKNFSSNPETAEDEIEQFLLVYMRKLWQMVEKKPQPYVVVLEEADIFIPQSGSTRVKKLFAHFASRGRKNGLCLVIVSQRPQKVDKNVVTQSEFFILHRVKHRLDLDTYADVIDWPKDEVKKVVPRLEKGEAVIVYDSSDPIQVRIKKRETFHPSSNPLLEQKDEEAPKLIKIDAAFLEKLREELASPAAAATADPALVERNSQLEKLVATKEAEIRKLKEEIANLKKPTPVIAPPQQQVVAKKPPPAPTPKPEAKPATIKITSPQLKELLPGEKAKFKALIDGFAKLDKVQPKIYRMHKEIFDTLERLKNVPGMTLTVRKLASQTKYQASTIANSPPTPFINAGLIRREGNNSKNYVYSSNLDNLVRHLIRTKFQGLDAEILKEEILKALP